MKVNDFHFNIPIEVETFRETLKKEIELVVLEKQAFGNRDETLSKTFPAFSDNHNSNERTKLKISKLNTHQKGIRL